MPDPSEQPITITLSAAQVEEVLRAATLSTAPGIAALISGTLRRRAADGTVGRQPRDGGPSDPAPGAGAAGGRLSRSLLRGLSILTCFGSAGEERGIVELSRESGMSASTTHRYALTLIELGLLERSPRSRKYRLPALPVR